MAERSPRLASALLSLLLLLAVACGYGASPAPAATGITSFTASPSTTQAGGHPNLNVEAHWLDRADSPADPCFCDDARVLSFHYPTGFIGNPHALPVCTLTEFNLNSCPESSQVGIVHFGVGTGPLYNMETHPDQAGLLALVLPLINAPAFIDLSGRTESDYGLDSTSAPIIHLFPAINALGFTIWGVPAAPSHDLRRFHTPLIGIGVCNAPGEIDLGIPCDGGTVTGASSTVPPAPYLQNPTTCGVPLTAGMDLTYYNGDAHHADYPWPATTGCQQLSFNPSLTAVPTTDRADSPSGLDINLRVPQNQSPGTPSPSEIRSNVVTLPPGFSINANAADGKAACADAETGIGTRGPASCPEFSKVGTLSLDVASLPGPISGALYLGEPEPGDRYRLVLAADGFGTHVKLVGLVRPDPQSGQLVASFDLPQANLQEVSLHLFGSERGLLATPTRCGTYPVSARFVPWDSDLPTQTSLSFFTIDSGPNGGPCPNGRRPFAPVVRAGSANSTAGAHAPFALTVAREDGDQELTGLTVKAPPGFSATLRGVPRCPEAAISRLAFPGYSGLLEQATPSCPEASRVGSVVAEAGAGSRPVAISGNVYLAGPYAGAPLSLVAVVPAVSGPYDLGNVAVRAAIHVDPVSAQVTTVSDPLPQILEGVPLRTRLIQIDLDRPGFALNPTDCDPLSVDVVTGGSEGGSSEAKAPFQVANCADLGFGPRLDLRFSGASGRNGHPALSAVLTTHPGEANIARTVVTLPHSEFLDNAHISSPCTRVQFAAEQCPAGSVIGRAVAETPLLDRPLEGTVYLRSSSHKLPDIVVALKGEFEVELDGRVDSVGGRLRTSFETVPDVPVDRFSLSLLGGRKGLLINSEDLCARTRTALVQLSGQNGVRSSRASRVRTACAKTARQRRGHEHGPARRPRRGGE